MRAKEDELRDLLGCRPRVGSGIAVEKLPDRAPLFIRTAEAAAEIAVMGRELDSPGLGPDL